MDKIISIPNGSDYCFFVKSFLENVTLKKVILQSRSYSSIFGNCDKSTICSCFPFKFNLNSYINSLKMGANILFSFDKCCKCSDFNLFYKTVLSDLGYSFNYYDFFYNGKFNFKYSYNLIKEINPNITKRCFLYEVILLKIRFFLLNSFDKAIINKDIKDIDLIRNKFIDDILINRNFNKLFLIYFKYIFKLKLTKNKTFSLKIGIVENFDSLIDILSFYDLEHELKKYNLYIKRFSFEFFKKINKYYIKFKIRNYLKYYSLNNSFVISKFLYFCRKKYDGIIYINSVCCASSSLVIPILEKISNDFNIPILFLSIDDVIFNKNLQGKINSFYNMILNKK